MDPTNASGMKKNRYGNIEDIVIEATLVTPSGTLETRRPAARTSAGMQPLSLLFGSEGNLGVITRALIAIHPTPEEIRYQSLVFRTFGDGVAFLKAVRGAGALPASIRLVNNREFRFGQALRPAAHGAARWKSTLQRAWLTRVLGFDPSMMAACSFGLRDAALIIRPARTGTDAPACEKMKRTSLKRANAPLNIRLATARAVSCGYSIIGAGTPGMRLPQQFGATGWKYATALRRLSSSNTGL